jgi:hypothetical protein
MVLEVEKPYYHLGGRSKDVLLERVVDHFSTEQQPFVVLPFLVEKESLVTKYRVDGKGNLSTRYNLHDGTISVVYKGEKTLVKLTEADERVVVRPERKIVVVDKNEIDRSIEIVLDTKGSDFEPTETFLRKKITAFVVDKQTYRVYAVNIDSRETAVSEEEKSQLEIEYTGILLKNRRPDGRRIGEVCAGVLAVSTEVVRASEEFGSILVAKHQQKSLGH